MDTDERIFLSGSSDPTFLALDSANDSMASLNFTVLNVRPRKRKVLLSMKKVEKVSRESVHGGKTLESERESARIYENWSTSTSYARLSPLI